MVCDRKSNDPLANLFYEKEGFIILGRGFQVDKFFPGRFITRPTEATGRGPFVQKGADLFTNWSDPKVDTEHYNRFSRDTWSGKLSATVAADLSTSLTGQDASASSLNGEFTKSNVTSLKVALMGARLWTIDESNFDIHSSELEATKHFRDNAERGYAHYLITHALSVTAARIELEDHASASGFLNAAQTSLAKLAIKLGLDTEKKDTLVFDAPDGEVMIAFRCLELFVNSDFNITGLGAPTETFAVRRPKDRKPTEFVKRDEFDAGEDLVLRVEAD